MHKYSPAQRHTSFANMFHLVYFNFFFLCDVTYKFLCITQGPWSNRNIRELDIVVIPLLSEDFISLFTYRKKGNKCPERR